MTSIEEYTKEIEEPCKVDNSSDFKYSAIINVPPLEYGDCTNSTYYINSDDNNEFKIYIESFVKEISDTINKRNIRTEECNIVLNNRVKELYKEIRRIKSTWWYKLFTKINL